MSEIYLENAPTQNKATRVCVDESLRLSLSLSLNRVWLESECEWMKNCVYVESEFECEWMKDCVCVESVLSLSLSVSG